MAGWLDAERRRSDGLLYQMLPPEVASCLKNEERAPAQEHPEVSLHWHLWVHMGEGIT